MLKDTDSSELVYVAGGGLLAVSCREALHGWMDFCYATAQPH